MSENETSEQQPEMASFPDASGNSFDPNQLVQQQLLAAQASQLAGMQFNGFPSAPQMVPNFSMYSNPYQMMSGMQQQQQFNPMQSLQVAAQMPSQPPMAPLVANRNQNQPLAQMGEMMNQNQQFAQMGGQMPMFLSMGYQMPMGGVMQMMGQMPICFIPVPVPNPFPLNCPLPILMKAEEDHSVLECTPVDIQIKNFSVAHILKPTKKEEADPEGADTKSVADTEPAAAEQPIDTSASANIPDALVPPSPIIPSTPIQDQIVDSPASPDYVNEESQICTEQEKSPLVHVEQADDSVAHPTVEVVSSLEKLAGCDEYLSADETVDKPEDDVSLSLSLSLAHSDTLSLAHESLPATTTHDALISPAHEIVARRGVWVPVKESCEVNGSIEGEEMKEQRYGGKIDSTVDESERNNQSEEDLSRYRDRETSPPVVPPRFPRRKKVEEEEKEERSSRKRDISPNRWSPVTWNGGDEIKESHQKEKTQVNNKYSLLVKGVPSRMERHRIRRFFDEKYGKCRLMRLEGESGTVRIEFDSKKDRDRAAQVDSIVVCRENLTVHEDVIGSEKDTQSKEDVGQSRGLTRNASPSVVSSPSLEAINKLDAALQLETSTITCNGRYRKDIILTAGPLPMECSATSVVAYFRGLQCKVLAVPFPGPRLYEYLILRFADVEQARRILTVPEHRVLGHLIPVSPPFDVHLQLNGMRGWEGAVMLTLQHECGVMVSHPSLPYLNPARIPSKQLFGYVTFGRPEDGEAAIKKRTFWVDGRPFYVTPSDHNYSFMQFQEVWEGRAGRAKAEQIARRLAEEKKLLEITGGLVMAGGPVMKKKNSIKKTTVVDERPILTLGPIPAHCLNECDEYLLSNFEDVHEIPFDMKDSRHFRILSIRDPNVISDLLTKGYVRVGAERILISPSYDVAFIRGSKSVESSQLIIEMQRKYGPIVRHLSHKQGRTNVTFGRIQDGVRAIADSPHFQSVMAVECEPNDSFRHFVSSVDMQVLLDRGKEAHIMEAANIRSRTHVSASNEGKRRHKESENFDVILCSPTVPKKKKKSKPEVIGVSVRVNDPDDWIPSNMSALVDHFAQFGKVTHAEYKDHLEAFIHFEEPEQELQALETPFVKIEGVWLDILPLN